jgi:hypothetical protein
MTEKPRDAGGRGGIELSGTSLLHRLRGKRTTAGIAVARLARNDGQHRVGRRVPDSRNWAARKRALVTGYSRCIATIQRESAPDQNPSPSAKCPSSRSDLDVRDVLASAGARHMAAAGNGGVNLNINSIAWQPLAA